MSKPKFADGVFEGGGVKGIGLVGAVAAIEKEGYTWQNLAGTSAGAIVASLLAAGYTASELKNIIGSLDYQRFKDLSTVDHVPLLGPLINIYFKKGIYGGDYFENWIDELLRKKGVRVFGDLVLPGISEPRYRYKLNVVTSDITNGLLVVLPQGVNRYGLDPDKFSVSKAVRMSMSIPFFFEAVKLTDTYFVDGGILSNFPVWLFDSEEIPEWPTFGFKLIEPEDGRPYPISSPISFAKAIVSTMMDAHDKMHIETEDFTRTIPIPTLGVGTTEFNLSPEKRDALYLSGVKAAEEFIRSWDFSHYIQKFRVQRNPQYLQKIAKLKRNLTGATSTARPSVQVTPDLTSVR